MTETVAVETDLDVDTEPGDRSDMPRLVRLRRTRAKKRVGYLCLRALTDTSWMLTRHYDLPVFGIVGHTVWEGFTLWAAIDRLAAIVQDERTSSIHEFQNTIFHFEKCARQEALGEARPPAGFRAGWAKAMIPKARSRADQNRRHWVRNLESLKTKLAEAGWPTDPIDSLPTPM